MCQQATILVSSLAFLLSCLVLDISQLTSKHIAMLPGVICCCISAANVECPALHHLHCPALSLNTSSPACMYTSKRQCSHPLSGSFAGAESAVSMKRLISHMRKQRIGMVQTVQQYVFIYQAIFDELREAFSDGRYELEPSPVSAPGRVSRSLSVASSSSQG